MAETLAGNKILKTRIVLKNDTAENWSNSTGVLLKGEIGIEIDTRKFKIGDGTSDWQALPYANMSIEEIESLFDEKAISIYESLQSWKIRKEPIQYISFCKSMVIICIFISYSAQKKELRIPFGLSKSKISLIEPINSFLDGRNV